MQGHASDPSSEDHKETRKLALVHSLLTLGSLPSQRRPSGPTGTAETSWHHGGNRRQARRWKTTGRLFPVIETLHGGRGGAVAASNREEKKLEEGGSVEPQMRTGGQLGRRWRGGQWCQSRKIICTQRVGWFLLLTTLPVETRGGQCVSASGIPTRIITEQQPRCRPYEAHVGAGELECADE